MPMPYSSNEKLPYVRMEVVRLVRKGWSTVKVARHTGFSQSAIVKWVQRAPDDFRAQTIPTRSSRPLHHPREFGSDMIQTVLAYRRKYERGALALQYFLKKDGVDISASSIKRILRSHEMSRWSRWKKRHTYPPRPLADAPGALVELDTIHHGPYDDRLYVYTLIDVHSRWAYAAPCLRINTHRSLQFVEDARLRAPFTFRTVQSDHGSEFSKWFTKHMVHLGMAHRHSRIRTPNDNAHLERFNRTIQEECLDRVSRSLRIWRKEIPEYLHWYNHERPHMGLDMKTPEDILKTIPRS